MTEQHTYELSHGQKRIWLQMQMEPNPVAFNQPAAILIKRNIDKEYLNAAVNKVIERHFILRTVFSVQNGEPRQEIKDKMCISVHEIEFPQTAQNNRWNMIQEDMLYQTSHQFDLGTGPLLNVCLYRMSESECILYICMHHIIVDGWSMDLFYSELFHFYQSFCDSQQPDIPELPIQYVDYAHWQNKRVSDGILNSQLLYWKEKLSGELPALNLPTDYIRPTNRSFDFRAEELILDQNIKDKLDCINSKAGTTMFMMMTACISILLHKLANQKDILIGTPIAGRNNRQVRNLIGNFVNTVVLRNEIKADMPFITFLGEVRKTCIEAYSNQEYPFDALMRELKIKRNVGRGTAFDVLINFASSITKEDQFKMIPFDKIDITNSADTGEFDLSFTFEDYHNQLKIKVYYSLDLFSRSTVRRFMENYKIIVSCVADNPHTIIKNISFLSFEERQLIQRVNDTAKLYSSNDNIISLFNRNVKKHPDSVCIRYEREDITYWQLDKFSNQVGNLLIKYGLQSEQPVVVMMDRSPELIAVLLGILKAGGAYVPIDPTYPIKRIRYMLEDCNSSMIMIHKRHLENQIDVAYCVETCIAVSCQGSTQMEFEQISSRDNLYERSRRVYAADTPIEEIYHDDKLAYIIYTSGSTGNPKGVMISHEAVNNTLLWLQDEFTLSETDVVAQKTSSSFTDSVWEFFWTLMAGAKMIIIPEDIVKDPIRLYQKFKVERITVTQFVPALLRVFLEVVRSADEENPLPALRWCFNGGEALQVELVVQWYEIFRSARIANIYGMTESAIYATYYKIVESPSKYENSVPLGTPIANTHVYIMDESGKEVGINTHGQICIGGKGVTSGYWQQPELTERAFIRHPETGEKLYCTGDFGYYRPDGIFEYLGRRDEQVQLRGFRVELKEVEHAVLNHKAVREAAVILSAEHEKQQDIVCYYTIHKDYDLCPEDLRKYLKTVLPDYMIPSHFIVIDEMPLTSHGKINRRKLPDVMDDISMRKVIAFPTNQIEQNLVEIWKEILGIDNVGIKDNFIELGGHSMKMARMIYQIQEKMEIHISFKDILENQTIKELAGLIQKKTVER